MSFCLSKRLDEGSLLESAAPIIYMATELEFADYTDAKGPASIEFTEKCMRFVLDELIEANLSGNTLPLINPTTELGEPELDNTFLGVAQTIMNTIAMRLNTRISGDTTAMAESYLLSLYSEAIKNTKQQAGIKETDIPSNAVVEDPILETLVEDTEDAKIQSEDEMPDREVANVATFQGKVHELIGTQNFKYLSAITDHLQHLVATIWVDGRVVTDVNNNTTVRGYTSKKQAADAVRATLSSRIKRHFVSDPAGVNKDLGGGVIATSKNGYSTEYILLDKIPDWFQMEDDTNPLGIKLAVCNEFPVQYYRDGSKSKIKFIATDSIDDAITFVQNLDLEAVVYEPSNGGYISSGERLSQSISNPRNMDENALPAYYSYIVSTGQNYSIFMDYMFPTLSESYKNTVRTGSMDEGTISGEAQDSASLTMHKQAVMRLKKNADQSFSVSTENPYLTSDEILKMSDYLSKLPASLTETRAALTELINSKTSVPQAGREVLASMYQRFFAEEDYIVSNFVDPDSGEKVSQTMRSYAAMVEKNSHNIVTVQDYYDNDESNESSVSKIDDVLSALLSSKRSIIISDKAAEYNGRYRKTNVAGSGVTLASFNQDITSAVLGRNSIKTNKSLLWDQIITVMPVEGNLGTFMIRIHPRDTNNKPIKDSYVEYTIGINKSGKESDKLSGKPITVLSRKSVSDAAVDAAAIADLFKQFKLPNAIVNKANLDIVRSALSTDTIVGQDGKDIGENLSLDSLYLNMLFPIILNAEEGVAARDNLVKEGNLNAALTRTEGSPMEYDILDTVYDYKSVLTEIIDRTEGVKAKKSMKGFRGETLSAFGQQSLINRIGEYASQAAGDSMSIHRDNILVGRDRLFTAGKSYIKQGIAIGDAHKAVVNMTVKENLKFLIESAYLQTIVKSGDRRTTAIQPGAQADRQHPQLTEFTIAKKGINFFELKQKDGKPTSELDYDIYVRRTVASHASYYKNIETALCTKWNAVLSDYTGTKHNHTTVGEIASALNNAKIPADLAMSDYGLQQMIYFDVKKTKKGNFAGVPEDIIQSIQVFTSQDENGAYPLAEKLLESNRKAFRAQLVASGYKELPEFAISNINKVTGLNFSKDRQVQAMDILFDSYFYNAQILGTSALNLVTGGLEQFDLKKAKPLFTVDKHVDPKLGLNYKQVITTANSISIPGSDKTLGEISIEELLSIRERSKTNPYIKSKVQLIDDLTRIKFLLNSDMSEKDKAEDIWLYDTSRHINEKFISQVKRNQTLGSGLVLPRLTTNKEHGFRLGDYCKVVSVKDDKAMRSVLGLSGGTDADATDGVVLVHPLYVIKLNNSLGNNESSFMCNGVAMKNISIEIDEYGQMRIQKKAEFDIFSPEILKKGNALLYNMLTKMNSTIQFKNKNMLVHQVDDRGISIPLNTRTFSAIDINKWKKYGLSYGNLYYTADPDAETVVINARTILGNLSSPAYAAQFEAELAAGKYTTDKLERSFDTLQDLYEYYGEYENDDAFKIIAGILGTTPSNVVAETNLSDAEYDDRDNYIEKICMTSEEKTGSKNIISWKNLIDPSYGFVNPDTKNARWSSISNKHHGMILQPEHGFDVTNARTKKLFEHTDKSTVSLITQLIAAVSAEGQSGKQAAAISGALNMLTSSAMTQMRRMIIFRALDLNPDLDSDSITELDGMLRGTITEPSAKQRELLVAACNEYARELVMASLSKQENPGLAAELLSDKFRESLSFDQKQILPLVQSQLFAETEKRAVRTKFAGGQFVVSPSHNMMTLYSFAGSDNLTREDLNQLVYFGATKSEYAHAKDASLQIVPRVITPEDMHYIMPTDFVMAEDGGIIRYSVLKRALKSAFNSAIDAGTIPGDMPFSMFLGRQLTNGAYLTKLTFADKGRELSYTNWFKYSAAGDAISVFDTDAFKTYDAIAPIRESKMKGDTATDFAKDNDISTLPKGLFKTYYFDVISKKNGFRTGANKTTLLTSAELAEFSAWYNNVLKSPKTSTTAVKEMYNYIGEKAIVDKSFEQRMKADLYDSLESDTTWTSKQAEVHMPYMHCDDFLIDDGSFGTIADSLFDITKGAQEPNWDKLFSMKVITRDQLDNFKSNYYEASNAYKLQIQTESTKYAEGSEEYKDFLAKQSLFNAENEKAAVFYGNITGFFKNRLRNQVTLGQNQRYVASHYSNTFAFADKVSNVFDARNAARKSRNNFVPGSLSYVALTKALDKLNKLPVKADLDSITTAIDGARQEFISKQCQVLATNFPRTLDLMMARIPGPSKQTAVSARIKSFVFSSKNSMYGPVELLMMAGLDFDIDKQNMMTWSTEDGKIVDWKAFGIGTGKSNVEVENMLTDTVNTSCSAVAVVFEQQINALIDAIARKQELVRATSVQDINYKKHVNALIKLEKAKANLQDDRIRVLRATESKIRSRFTKAIQNYVVANLHEMALDPKNAIELSAMTSTAKLKDATVLPDLSTANIKSLSDILVSQNLASAMNPFSVPFYENITMAGRSGIGIYASDTKAYYAAYNASINASPSEQRHVALKTDLTVVENKDKLRRFKVDFDQLQFFAKSENEYKASKWSDNNSYSTGDYVVHNGVTYKATNKIKPGTNLDSELWEPDIYVLSASRLANAEKWSTEGRQLSAEVADAVRRLKVAKTPEEQEDIVISAIGGAEKLRSMNLSDQAWDMFSQLVNAAADNAKELILGKLGATNTTGSLISTMVRFGVDIRHIIGLINDPRVQTIVRDIEQKSDIKTQQEDEERAFMCQELYEKEYNKKLIDRLKAALPRVNTDTDAGMVEYLTNPIRLLYTYAKATQEFSTLSKMLSINQGLPNDAFSGYNFIASINSMINAPILAYNESNSTDKLPLFDMEQFVSAFNRKDEENASIYIKSIIDNFDTVRTGINVPYTILKNELFISYFNALFQTKAIRDSISKTNELCEYMMKSFHADYISEDMYKELSDSVYDVGVVQYLKEVVGTNNPLVLNGKTYDLSLPRKRNSSSKINGRLEFLVDMPEALSVLEDNDFKNSLSNDLVASDAITGISIVWLKGPDLSRLRTNKLVELQIGLDKIAKENPALYNALFYYSLITTKGGYSGGSFAGLFPVEKYNEFARSLKKNSAIIPSIVRNNLELMNIANPKFLQQVRTVKDEHNTESTRFEDEDDTQQEELNMYDDDTQEIELAQSALSNRVSFARSLTHKKFKVSGLNELVKSRGDKTAIPRYVRSKDNSLTYMWNADIKSYVPLLNSIPRLAIPLTITDNQGSVSLEDNGFEQGFRAIRPGYTENDGTPQYCNVLFYLSPRIVRTIEAYGELKDLVNARGTNTTDLYVVRTKDGYELIPGERLRNANGPFGYTFKEELIIMGNQLAKDIDTTKTFIYNLHKDSAGNYYSKAITGTTPVDIPYSSTMGVNEPAVYDVALFKKVAGFVKAKVSETDITERYNKLVTQIAYYRFRSLGHTETFDSIIAGTAGNRAVQDFRNVKGDVMRALPGDTYVNMVLSLSQPLTDVEAALGFDLPDYGRTYITNSKYLIEAGTIDKKLLDAIASKETVEALSIGTVFKILSNVLQDTDKIDSLSSEYANIVLTTGDRKKDILFVGGPTGKTYVSKESKSAATKLTNDSVLSKPIKVPANMKYEYRKAVTPNVLFAICSHLNKTFPGIEWRVMNTAAIKRKFGEDFPTNKGFVNVNGTIVINSDEATIETPFHEFGHVYLQHLKIENPDTYAELMNAAMDHPLFSSVSDAYKMLTATERAEETVVELISMRAADTLINSSSDVHTDVFSVLDGADGVNGEVMTAIKIWLSKLLNNNSVMRLTLTTNDSLATTINKLADDMVYGKNSVLAQFSQETRDKIRKLSDSYELPLEEARQILVDRGYMQWYCV